MSGKQIPKGWYMLLERLWANGFPEATIAGGAVRDWVLEKPIKDIDVFVQDRGEAQLDRALGFLKNTVMREGAAKYIGSVEEVTSATEYRVPYVDHPVQVITLREMTSHRQSIERIDFGLCRAYFDGWRHFPIYLSDAFYEDSRLQTFTLLRCENQSQFDRSMQRWERLREKFPGFRLVIPYEFHEYTHKQEA